jgi:hypothetical protein
MHAGKAIGEGSSLQPRNQKQLRTGRGSHQDVLLEQSRAFVVCQRKLQSCFFIAIYISPFSCIICQCLCSQVISFSIVSFASDASLLSDLAL